MAELQMATLQHMKIFKDEWLRGLLRMTPSTTAMYKLNSIYQKAEQLLSSRE
jgi:hypothetical protein